MPRATNPRVPAGPRGAALLALAAWFLAGSAVPAGAQQPTFDPRLLEAADVAPAETVTVWVRFRDKGARDEADLARRLDRAAVALTPRARERRRRAGIAALVDERDLPVEASYLERLTAAGFRPFAASRWLNQVALRIPGGRVRELGRFGFVESVRRVPRVTRSEEPAPSTDGMVWPPPGRSDSRLPGDGAERAPIDYGSTRSMLDQIGVPALHDSGYVGTGLLIAVLDEGFNGFDRHAALAGVTPAPGLRRDFVEGDTVVTDTTQDLEHGLWTLGLIASNLPGSYVGAAFGASFALARTEIHLTEHRVEMLYWAQAAEWADSIGADIISSSLGYFTFDAPDPDYTFADMNGRTTDVSRAAEIACARGILVVNSVGNEGNNSVWGRHLIAPSDVSGDSLIAVGAVDGAGLVASFSSRGPTADGRVKPDLAARGVSDVLLHWDGASTYTVKDGTSFAAPLVAGLAACLWQARPSWRATEVIRALRSTASLAWAPDNRIGYGIPNGGAALAWRGEAPLPPGVALVRGPNPLRADGPPIGVRFVAAGAESGPQDGRVAVFDVTGRRVRSLWTGRIARGQGVDVTWDGRDDDGGRVPPGIYTMALSAGGELVTARVVSLR